MGYQFFKRTKVSIHSSNEYKEAVFGFFHVVFLDNDGNYVLPIEDRDSIIEALKFYKDRILKRKSYPVYDGEIFVSKDCTDKEVLFQVLGLPDVVFNSLDLNHDISEQLTFKDGLSALKKESYLTIYDILGRKWFTDDFKLYCLKNGIFFLYDETKPFVENDNPVLPVYFNEDKLSKSILKVYRSICSERIAIDFLCDNYDKCFVDCIREYDSYSFDRLVSYFINDEYDEELSSINKDPVFRNKFSKILRKFTASLINMAYDQYCFEVLNKVTTKMSYLSVAKIDVRKKIYCKSSFYGDMFSYDDKKYIFSLYQKDAIGKRIRKIIDRYGVDDILGVYTRLALPFDGYQFVKNKEIKGADEFISSLPFSDDISMAECYLSSKRYDAYYSYLPGEKEHKQLFLSRYLTSFGIEYYPVQNAFHKNDKLSIRISDVKRSGILSTLFDAETYSLCELVLPSYMLKKDRIEDDKLEEAIRKLDLVSNNTAGHYFFTHFNNLTLDEAIDKLLCYFDCYSIKNTVTKFFRYLVKYPFVVAENEYRRICLNDKDISSLQTIDSIHDDNFSYEPNLPYPCVSKGETCYSFQNNVFSKPYLCSCCKEAIEKNIDYLSKIFDKKYSKFKKDIPSMFGRNSFILSKLGLPDNIVALIDPYDDIGSQIPYKDHICHVCQKTSPTKYDSYDSNIAEPYNVFSSYIFLEANKKGLHFTNALYPNTNEFIRAVKKGDYYTLLEYDAIPQDPLLIPYLGTDKLTIASLLAYFFPGNIEYDDFIQDMYDFLSLGDETIKKLLFDCDSSLYHLIGENLPIFTRLLLIFSGLRNAYSFYLGEKKLGVKNQHTCLNFDYNDRLPHPYVVFGNTFNAYTDDIVNGPYYFCECEKDTMKEMLSQTLENYERRGLPNEIKTPIILAMAGFPYLVIHKMRNFDFSSSTIEEFFSKLSFRDSICRRCTGITHAANEVLFERVYPFNENRQAEYRFANSAMAKDGFMFVGREGFIQTLPYIGYAYDLDSFADPRLPYLYYLQKSAPEIIFRTFTPNKDEIRMGITELGKEIEINQEVLAYATGIILDTYLMDSKVFFKMMENILNAESLRKFVYMYFPQISRVRKELVDDVIQVILMYLNYLYRQLMNHYVDKELHIGR